MPALLSYALAQQFLALGIKLKARRIMLRQKSPTTDNKGGSRLKQ